MWQLLTEAEEETWNDQPKSLDGSSSIKGIAKVGAGLGQANTTSTSMCVHYIRILIINLRNFEVWNGSLLLIYVSVWISTLTSPTLFSIPWTHPLQPHWHALVCLPDGRFFTHINQPSWYLWRDGWTLTQPASESTSASYGSCYAVVLVVIWWMIRPSSPEPHKYEAIHIYIWTECPCALCFCPVKCHPHSTSYSPQKLLIRYSDLIFYPDVHFLSPPLLYVRKCQFIGKYIHI